MENIYNLIFHKPFNFIWATYKDRHDFQLILAEGAVLRFDESIHPYLRRQNHELSRELFVFFVFQPSEIAIIFELTNQ